MTLLRTLLLTSLPLALALGACVDDNAFFSNIGPTSTPASRPLPSFSPRANSTDASVNFFATSLWT